MSFNIMVIILVIAGAHDAHQKEEVVVIWNRWQSPPAKSFFPANMILPIKCMVRGFSPQNLSLEMSAVHVSVDGTRETGQLVGAISVKEEFAAYGRKWYR
ncbi:hypothetical protein V1264_017393 [Littorina saxatilis]|uniref:Uncharacterized protein n=1 Tax=Littorina saxatilis TaxID=31220 RepID=A0AAN9GFC5_9CAEN